MAAIQAPKYIISRFLSATITSSVNINFISTSRVLAGGQRWRVSNDLAGDGLAYGPLTDLPDWSFVDGEPAPESKTRRKRQNRRIRESERIMQYLEDVESPDQRRSPDKT